MCQKVQAAIEVLGADTTIESMNLTDADSLIMKGKKGNFDTHYNVQVACCEDQIITYNNVVQDGNDKAQLIPALQGIQANTDKQVQVLLADADFGTLDSLEYMDRHHICGFVPYKDMNAPFEEQPFHYTHFVYDPQLDRYTCPAMQSLEFMSIVKDSSRNKQFRQYKTSACKTCPLAQGCVTNKKSPYRKILRDVRQELRDDMKHRLNSEEGKKMYARRLHPIEAIFGHLKYNLGFTRFLLRGLDKVKAEFALICLTYNLRKLAKHRLFQGQDLNSALFRPSEANQIWSYPIFQRTWALHLSDNYIYYTHEKISSCVIGGHSRSPCMAKVAPPRRGCLG